jgi:hypothetical protein
MTVHTESFDKAPSTTLGPDLSWTEASGDLQVVNQKCTNVNLGETNRARADSDLATSDNYAQAVIRVDNLTSTIVLGVCCRYATLTDTCYMAQAVPILDIVRLYKVESGVLEQIGSNTAHDFAANTDYTLKVQAVGTTIKVFVDGVEKMSETDGDIATGLRGGVAIYDDTSTDDGTINNFEYGDVTAGGSSIAASLLLLGIG